ncbi:MAG: serine hydrolase domain-containing protein [Rhodoglobus sp.]
MSTSVHGSAADRFHTVAEAFRSSFEGKPDMGAALAIRHDGDLVVDLWGGVADERDKRNWQEDTLGVVFSCTKGLVSILAAVLVQEGRLDYSARVADYWPEFAAAGKENVRIKDLLAHRSGISAPREAVSIAEVRDWNGIVSRLAAQEPLWVPDTGYAYHALTHGWLAGEVIRRVTGLTVGEYFSKTISAPLGVDAWIGLPSLLNDRVAHLQAGPSLKQLTAQQAAARTPGVMDWSEQAMTLGGAFPSELVGRDSGFNSPDLWSAEIPGAGGIASARALATIWSATFVETDGVRLLNDGTIAAATAVQSEGAPVWDVPGPWPRWGMGFQLDSEARRYITGQGFGHDGAGGQVAFADPQARVGFAFITNQMEAIDDVRATRVVDALRAALET